MSAFTGGLTVTSLDEDSLLWRLEQPLQYEVGALGSSRFVKVPAGFETDVASIPAPIRWVLPAWGRYSRAAIIHDYLYARLDRAEPHPEGLTRKAADAVFHEAMLVSKVPRTLALIIWAAVRIGGSIDARRKRRRK